MRLKRSQKSASGDGAASPPPRGSKGGGGKIFIIAVLLIIISLGLGAMFLPQLLVDPKKLADEVSTQVKAMTGRSLNVKGGTQFTLLPSPKLVLTNVEIDTGTDNAYSVPRLRADALTVELGFDGLLQAKPQPKAITLVRPVLEVERSHDGSMHWDWLTFPGDGKNAAFAFNVEGGRAIYFNPGTEKTVRAEDINVTVASNTATGLSVAGRASYLGKALNVKVVLPPHTGGKGTRIELRVWQSDATSLSAVLERVATPVPAPKSPAADVLPADDAVWHGDLKLQVEDINQWLPKEEVKEQERVDLIGGQTVPKKVSAPVKPPYPVKLAGKLDYTGNAVKISDVTVESSDTAGKGEMMLTMAAIPSLKVQLKFNQLKLQAATLSHYLGSSHETAKSSSGGIAAPPSPVDIAEASPRIPKEFNLIFDLGVDSMMLDSSQFTGVELNGQMSNGELAIGLLKGNFTGDTVIALSGKMVDTARGMRFEGRTKTVGKDFRTALSAFDAAAMHLPEKGFKEFSVDSNVFLSSEQMRLSEADFKLGELHLNGGLVTYFEKRPRVEADIVLKDINLDYFRDNWREEVKASGQHNFIFKINSSVDFSWLRNLKPIVDLRVNLQRFTFMEKAGDLASFQLYAEQNVFGIRNIEMRFPNGSIKGNINVTVSNAIPSLDVDLEFPDLNTNYFSEDGKQFGETLMDPDKPDARWSESLFDFSWMIGLTVKFNIAVQRFIHHAEVYDRMLLQGNMGNEQMQIGSLSFERFGGKFDFGGYLTGGKVPGLSGRFTMYNMDLKQVLSNFLKVNQVSGRMSLSGALSTSGISFLEWLKQADVKMVIAGRGVRVDNFNLHGVSDAVLASRSVAEVVTNVNKVLPTAFTDFNIDGSVNISGATMRSPSLTMAANYEQGSMSGELRLLQWKMALNSVYQMRMLPTETSVPTLTVDVSGTPEQHEMKLDTSSLEAYVAKRIVGD